MKNSLVLFYSQDLDEQVIGFQILSTKEAIKFKKAAKILEDNQSTYSFGDEEIQWKGSTIQIKPLSTSEMKTINSIFEMDYDNGVSKIIGFMPDAIEQAQDEELMDENGKAISLFGDQYQDEQNQEEDEDYY